MIHEPDLGYPTAKTSSGRVSKWEIKSASEAGSCVRIYKEVEFSRPRYPRICLMSIRLLLFEIKENLPWQNLPWQLCTQKRAVLLQCFRTKSPIMRSVTFFYTFILYFYTFLLCFVSCVTISPLEQKALQILSKVPGFLQSILNYNTLNNFNQHFFISGTERRFIRLNSDQQ